MIKERIEMKNGSKNIWGLTDLMMRYGHGSRDLFANTVKIVFLKYLLSYPDRFENKCPGEFYKSIIDLNRKISNGQIDYQDIENVLLNLEYPYNDMKFIYCSYYNMFKTDDNSYKFCEVINNINIDEVLGMGKNFFELLYDKTSNDISGTGIQSTNRVLRKIAADLLDVNPGELYMDLCSGYSSSILSIQEQNYRYIGVEADQLTAYLSQMILAILGKTEGQVILDDCIRYKGEFVDKIFCESPLNLRYDYDRNTSFDITTKEFNVLVTLKVLELLKDNGKAVVTVPAKFLFSEMDVYSKVREVCVNNGLKAVVSLPALHNGRSLQTNMLYFDKTYSGPVKFIETKVAGTKTQREVLSDNDINNLCDSIKNGDNNFGDYIEIDRLDVVNNGSLLPAKHIVKKDTETYRSLDEVNKELSDLYSKLLENIK